MSILKCLQIKTATSAKSSGYLHSHHPLYTSNENLLSRLGGFRGSDSSLSFTCNPYGRLVNRISFGSLVVCKARQAFDAVQSVTDCSWNELVVATDNLVLMHFWAEQCPMTETMVKELAKEYAGTVECFKMNTVDYPNIPKQLGIKSISTMMFFKDGERKESISGDMSKALLKDTIEKYLDG